LLRKESLSGKRGKGEALVAVISHCVYIASRRGRPLSGTATITRLDPEEERGRIAGGRRNVEAALVLGTAFAVNQGKQSGSCLNLNELSALQKGELKQYAEYVEQKGKKLWYSEVDIENLKKQAIAQSGGAEADVFFMPDGYVIKIVEHNSLPLEFLDDRISLYNYLFTAIVTISYVIYTLKM